MAAMIVKRLLGGLLSDTVRLLAGVATGLLVCLVLVVSLIPALLLAGRQRRAVRVLVMPEFDPLITTDPAARLPHEQVRPVLGAATDARGGAA